MLSPSPTFSQPVEATHIFTDLYRLYLPEPHASLLSGIVFGEKLHVSQAFMNAIKVTGLLHMVVLSGINITLLGAFIGAFTKPFGRKKSALMTIGGIIGFIAFVGADPPVTRAGVMGILTLLALVYERKTLGLYVLFLSAVVVALFKFEWLTSVSFQLSFGATLGIMLWGNAPHRAQNDTQPSRWNKLYAYLEAELRPSFAAQAVTMPIIFWYFREISLIAPFSNLIVSFTVPPLMVFGFFTAILGYIHPWLGLLPAIMCYGLLEYVIRAIFLMSRLPHIFISFAGT